ncbi:hypothetical protein [Bradyrhizobium sp.]|uniref:hypothetical protein n=1 Tax=Bradyrhizobium sp. TaxID=376 RepID=UPI003D09D0C7
MSGNPKGRNSDAFQLWQRAREYGPRVLEFLWSVVDGAYDDDHIPPKFSDKISAGREILDRGFGKPTQAFSVESDGTDGKPVTFTLNIGAPNGDKDRDN